MVPLCALLITAEGDMPPVPSLNLEFESTEDGSRQMISVTSLLLGRTQSYRQSTPCMPTWYG